MRTVRASELTVSGARSELLLAICQSVGADRYLSGISGREYLDVAHAFFPPKEKKFVNGVLDAVAKAVRI